VFNILAVVTDSPSSFCRDKLALPAFEEFDAKLFFGLCQLARQRGLACLQDPCRFDHAAFAVDIQNDAQCAPIQHGISRYFQGRTWSLAILRGTRNLGQSSMQDRLVKVFDRSKNSGLNTRAAFVNGLPHG
jgi:hypothetical protein